MLPMTESIEHVVLRVLRQSGGLDVLPIANIVFRRGPLEAADKPTKSEIARVRRALRVLRNQGKIFRLGRMNINGSSERPRDVYADLKHAAAFVADHIARCGVEAFRSRSDLLA